MLPGIGKRPNDDILSKIPRVNGNLAYINVSGEGAKPVGPIGINRAEKELIMRRYKAN